MRFLSNLIAVVLILIIVGGLGYVGYTYYAGGSSAKPADSSMGMNMNMASGSMNDKSANSSHAGASDQSGQDEQLSPDAVVDQPADASGTPTDQISDTTGKTQAGQSADATGGTPTAKAADASDASQTGQTAETGQAMGSPAPGGMAEVHNNQLAMLQINNLLQNKTQLTKAIDSFNDGLKTMTGDPYAPTVNTLDNPGGGMNMGNSTTPAVPAPGNSNTTINIYPQNGQTGQSNAMSSGMSNMGVTYDANKMQQIHNGLYKVSVGMVLLDQLQKELVAQAENATAYSKEPVQYLTNQFTLTLQDKNKLDQALIYLNNALSVADINPYISTNGLIYNKDRMSQTHEGIMKLAEGVTTLNQLQDTMMNQMIFLSNKAQEYADVNLMSMNNMAPDTVNPSHGLFGNISTSTIFRVIEIIFILGLIFGILGFVNSLLKGSDEKIMRESVKSDETA